MLHEGRGKALDQPAIFHDAIIAEKVRGLGGGDAVGRVLGDGW